MDARKVTHDEPAKPFITKTDGTTIDLFNPQPEEIDIEWIAHVLSRLPRWNGSDQMAIPYSVAQHSFDVARRVWAVTGCTRVTLAALLHDAHEAIIGDIPSPVKEALFQLGLPKDVFKVWEARIDGAINHAVGLPYFTPGTWKTIIKNADMQAGLAEHRLLFPEGSALFAEWGEWDGVAVEHPWLADAAEHKFLETFLWLTEAL